MAGVLLARDLIRNLGFIPTVVGEPLRSIRERKLTAKNGAQTTPKGVVGLQYDEIMWKRCNKKWLYPQFGPK